MPAKPHKIAKPKRQKKRKSRTEVFSDSETSGSEDGVKEMGKEEVELEDKMDIDVAGKNEQQNEEEEDEDSDEDEKISASTASPSPSPQPQTKSQTEKEILTTKFKQFYMQKITEEFADDLVKIRESDDFAGKGSVDLLIWGLGLGVEGWGEGDMRRIVGS